MQALIEKAPLKKPNYIGDQTQTVWERMVIQGSPFLPQANLNGKSLLNTKVSMFRNFRMG